jgi:hypothetical protein
MTSVEDVLEYHRGRKSRKARRARNSSYVFARLVDAFVPHLRACEARCKFDGHALPPRSVSAAGETFAQD